MTKKLIDSVALHVFWTYFTCLTNVHRSNRYEACNSLQKSKNHKQKALQTDEMKIRYNCAKRYDVLYINCAKGIINGLVSVLNVIIFDLYAIFFLQ